MASNRRENQLHDSRGDVRMKMTRLLAFVAAGLVWLVLMNFCVVYASTYNAVEKMVYFQAGMAFAISFVVYVVLDRQVDRGLASAIEKVVNAAENHKRLHSKEKGYLTGDGTETLVDAAYKLEQLINKDRY